MGWTGVQPSWKKARRADDGNAGPARHVDHQVHVPTGPDRRAVSQGPDSVRRGLHAAASRSASPSPRSRGRNLGLPVNSPQSTTRCSVDQGHAKARRLDVPQDRPNESATRRVSRECGRERRLPARTKNAPSSAPEQPPQDQ